MVTKKRSGAKRTTAKKSAAKRPPAKRLTKAVPPPDNPLLRHQAEEAALGGGADEVEMARTRARALRLTKEMPTADATDETPPCDDDQ
jgi:hypothetical protein